MHAHTHAHTHARTHTSFQGCIPLSQQSLKKMDAFPTLNGATSPHPTDIILDAATASPHSTPSDVAVSLSTSLPSKVSDLQIRQDYASKQGRARDPLTNYSRVTSESAPQSTEMIDIVLQPARARMSVGLF